MHGAQSGRLEPVEPLPPSGAARHQPGLAQHAEVLRNGSQRDVEIIGELLDRFFAGGQEIEKLATVRIRDGMKHINGSGGRTHERIILKYSL